MQGSCGKKTLSTPGCANGNWWKIPHHENPFNAAMGTKYDCLFSLSLRTFCFCHLTMATYKFFCSLGILTKKQTVHHVFLALPPLIIALRLASRKQYFFYDDFF